MPRRTTKNEPDRVVTSRFERGASAATGGTVGVADGHNRMVAYTKNINYVRFPMTLLNRTPIQNQGLYQITTYWNRFGVVEFVYPSTVQYADGIG